MGPFACAAITTAAMQSSASTTSTTHLQFHMTAIILATVIPTRIRFTTATPRPILPASPRTLISAQINSSAWSSDITIRHTTDCEANSEMLQCVFAR